MFLNVSDARDEPGFSDISDFFDTIDPLLVNR